MPVYPLSFLPIAVAPDSLAYAKNPKISVPSNPNHTQRKKLGLITLSTSHPVMVCVTPCASVYESGVDNHVTAANMKIPITKGIKSQPRSIFLRVVICDSLSE